MRTASTRPLNAKVANIQYLLLVLILLPDSSKLSSNMVTFSEGLGPRLHCLDTTHPGFVPEFALNLKENLKESEAPPQVAGVTGMAGLGSTGGVMGGIIGGLGAGNAPLVKVAPPKKLVVSSGVMATRAVYSPSPSYPPIARAARLSGTVVLQATIGRDGTIQNLRVVSGPALLQQSALDTVRRWRYKPLLLDGVPVDVDTTIDVVYTLDE